MIFHKFWSAFVAQLNKVANIFWEADPIAQLRYEYDRAVEQLKEGRTGLEQYRGLVERVTRQVSANKSHVQQLEAETKAYLGLPDAFECLAGLIADAGGHREAARLFGAADAIRQHMGHFRFKIHQANYDTAVATVRDALGEQAVDDACAEGAALSTAEAIAYAQRGRGERKRPTKGWASLTPTERDVVQLVSEGLANNDIATRLFVSPRTVQTHLTHVYTKLGLSSRVQLAQEAARHA